MVALHRALLCRDHGQALNLDRRISGRGKHCAAGYVTCFLYAALNKDVSQGVYDTAIQEQVKQHIIRDTSTKPQSWNGSQKVDFALDYEQIFTYRLTKVEGLADVNKMISTEMNATLNQQVRETCLSCEISSMASTDSFSPSLTEKGKRKTAPIGEIRRPWCSQEVRAIVGHVRVHDRFLFHLKWPIR